METKGAGAVVRNEKPEIGRRRERLATFGVVVLAVVTVLLVVLALEHTSRTAADVGSAPSLTDTGAATTPRNVSASAAPSSAATGEVLLALAGDGTLVSAEPGSCDGAKPLVRFSTDGGTTFRRVRTSEPVSSVLAVSADSADDLGFVGTDRACDPQRFAGSTTGPRWDRVASADTSWHLLPGDKGSVHTPDGPARTPCRPVSLSPAAPVRVLCADSRVLGSSDAGASWVVLGRATDARLIAFSGPGTGYAIAHRQSCPEALLRTKDGGATWTRSHCFDGSVQGLAAHGQTVVAVAAGQVWTSDDAGTSWTAAS